MRPKVPTILALHPGSMRTFQLATRREGQMAQARGRNYSQRLNQDVSRTKRATNHTRTNSLLCRLLWRASLLLLLLLRRLY